MERGMMAGVSLEMARERSGAQLGERSALGSGRNDLADDRSLYPCLYFI